MSYPGHLTLWADFMRLEDAAPNDNYVPVVSEANFAQVWEALKCVFDEAIRDPTPHSSAYMIPAGAMDLVVMAVGSPKRV